MRRLLVVAVLLLAGCGDDDGDGDGDTDTEPAVDDGSEVFTTVIQGELGEYECVILEGRSYELELECP